MKRIFHVSPALMTSMIIFAVISICDEQPYKKVIHNIDPQAKCLDGSPPALHIH